MKPSARPIGTPYGIRGDHWTAGYHTGEDYLCPVGDPVRAPQDSRILHVGRDGGWGPAYGLHVIGECHLDGEVFRWIAAHLSTTGSLVPGARVARGYEIGKSGQSGNVTGPHLHFEVRHHPFTYTTDVHPSIVTSDPPQPTPQLDRQIEELTEIRDQLAAQIAAGHPGKVRRHRRDAAQHVRGALQALRAARQEVRS